MVRQARAVEVMDVWSAGGRHGRGPAHGPQVGEHQHSETSGAEASSRHHRLAGRAGPRRSGRHPHPPSLGASRGRRARRRAARSTCRPNYLAEGNAPPESLTGSLTDGHRPRPDHKARAFAAPDLAARPGRPRGAASPPWPARPWPERRGSRAVRPRASRMVPPPARFRPKLQQATVKHISHVIRPQGPRTPRGSPLRPDVASLG